MTYVTMIYCQACQDRFEIEAASGGSDAIFFPEEEILPSTRAPVCPRCGYKDVAVKVRAEPE